MDLRGMYLWSLERTGASLFKAVDGLSASQLAWRPCSTCNSIGSMVIHLGRVEDTWVHWTVGGAELWEEAGWHRKLGLPKEDRGWAYDTLPPEKKPALADMLAYFRATRSLLIKVIQELPEARWTDTPENRLKFNVQQIVAHVIIEENQHVGQIEYLRGMQKSP